MLKAYLLNTFLTLSVFWACNIEKKSSAPVSQNNLLYSRGEKVTVGNFSGTVWLNRLGAQDSTLHVNYGTVTFEPRARTHWHLHPGGQLLF
ncbi:MAG: cupin domain-containing protein, partial [candidate division KSB1 bacterium]|nr:cupin domain-containing protein [candidate division KSB1 bacterium]